MKIFGKSLSGNGRHKAVNPPIDSSKATVEGITLRGVHDRSECQHRAACTVHAPSDHHMRGFSLHWRGDRGIFERICDHGVGHPDPDQFDYWIETGQKYQMVHGCDACCIPPHRPEDRVPRPTRRVPAQKVPE